MKIWQEKLRTLQRIRDAGVPVQAYCSRCRTFFDVDIDALIVQHGPDYSLIGKRGKCRTPGCTGSCAFLVQLGAGVPFRKLG